MPPTSEPFFTAANCEHETGGQGRIRTSVARKERQIYSLLPLTTRPPVRLATRSRQEVNGNAGKSPRHHDIRGLLGERLSIAKDVSKIGLKARGVLWFQLTLPVRSVI